MARPNFWDDDPEAWDTLLVSGDAGMVRAPGIVEDVDVTIKNKIDKHHGPGIDGGTLTIQGEDVPEVKFTLKIWSREHLVDLEKFLAVIRPQTAKSKVKPRDFTHPILSVHGLKSLVFETITGPTQPDDKGFSKLTIAFSRFKLPPKQSATTTPKSSTAVASVYGTMPYDPNTIRLPLARKILGLPSTIAKPEPPPKSPAQKGSKP